MELTNARGLGVASTFTIRMLGAPLEEALRGEGIVFATSELSNSTDLLRWLTDPGSPIRSAGTDYVLLLVRIEDWLRYDAEYVPREAPERTLQVLQQRAQEFVGSLTQADRRSVPGALLLCPSPGVAITDPGLVHGMGEMERYIAAGARRWGLVLDWSEFSREAGLTLEQSYEPSSDRLAQIPFNRRCFNALARFLGVRVAEHFRAAAREGAPPSADVSGADAASKTSPLAKFFEALKVAVSISPLASAQLARASELTYRVAGFNTTPMRMSEAELEKVTEGGGEVWTISVKDRFGDYGLNGLMLLGAREERLDVDGLLLGCPILGKQVEDAMMIWLARRAVARRSQIVHVPFRGAVRNAATLEFLDRIGAEHRNVVKGGYEFMLPANELEQMVLKTSVAPEALARCVDRMESQGGGRS